MHCIASAFGSAEPVRCPSAGRYYALVTVHRAEATDDRDTLAAIVAALNELAAVMPVIFPLHPRTKAALERHGLALDTRIRSMPPATHGDFMRLLVNAAAVVTDSGGVQKEAFILEVPCFTLRNETEWNETVQSKWNVLLGSKPSGLAKCISAFVRPRASASGVFGDGKAAERIATLLKAMFSERRLKRAAGSGPMTAGKSIQNPAQFRDGARSAKRLSAAEIGARCHQDVLDAGRLDYVDGVSTLDRLIEHRVIFLDRFDLVLAKVLQQSDMKNILVIAVDEYRNVIPQARLISARPRMLFSAVVHALFDYQM